MLLLLGTHAQGRKERGEGMGETLADIMRREGQELIDATEDVCDGCGKDMKESPKEGECKHYTFFRGKVIRSCGSSCSGVHTFNEG